MLTAVIAGNVVVTSLRFLVVLLAGLGTSVLVARALGPQEFGTYRLVMGLVWGLEVAAVLAFPNAVTKFTAELSGLDERGRDARVLGFFARRATLMYLVVAVPVILLADHIAEFFHDGALAPLLVLGALAVLPGVYAGLLAGAMRGRERFRELAALGLGQSILGVAGTALVLLLGYGLPGLFVLFLVLNLANLALVALAMRGQWVSGGILESGLTGRMWWYGAVMGLIAVLGAVIWERSEVFFLGRWATTEQVGFYSLAYTLALHLRRLLTTSFGEVLFPVFARWQGMGDEPRIATAFVEATRYLMMVACPLVVGGMLFAEPAIRLLFGPAYVPAAPVLAILLVSAGAVALAQPAAAILVNKERFWFLTGSFAALAAGNVALDVLLIPAWAAFGAAVANTTTQLAAVVAQLVVVGRLLGTRVPLGTLVRSLAAAGVAALPAWGLGGSGDAAGLALGLLAFAVGYPIALRLAGALGREDVERLREAASACPDPVRRLVRGVMVVPSLRFGSRER
ncbi:MAG: lipopolysaccharide biosynthesis protein [Candidatus Rokuibacteriota bacterium]